MRSVQKIFHQLTKSAGKKVRTILLSFISVLFIPLSLNAGGTYCGDPTGDYIVQINSQSFTGVTHSGADYHQLYIAVDGNITISFTNTNNKATEFYVGSACTSPADIYNGSTDAATHTNAVYKRPVTGGTYLFLKIDDTNNNENYRIDIDFESPAIQASISPSTIEIPQGFSSVTLDVTLNRGAIDGNVTIDYTNSDDNSTNTLMIEKYYDTYSLLIDLNTSAPIGSDINITLIGGTVTSGSEFVYLSPTNYMTTITIGEPKADLAILNVIDSADPAKITTADFYYFIYVANKGSKDAEGVSVVTVLPDALKGNFNKTLTENTSAGWTCNRADATVTCSLDGNFTAGTSKTLQIHTSIPDDDTLIGQILEATVNIYPDDSSLDFDDRNNYALERTNIVSQYYVESSDVSEICYTDTTYNTMTANNAMTDAAFAKVCTKTGNFYSGNGCDATVDITVAENVATITDLNLTKMYAPEIVHGTCSDSQGCISPDSKFQDIDIEESPSYTKGYVYSISSVEANTTFTISDYDTYDGNPNNPAPLDGIGLYAVYLLEGVTHKGRVKDCSGNAESGYISNSTADAVDTPITGTNVAAYNNSNDTSSSQGNNPASTGLKWIQTMVASGTHELTAVHLNKTTQLAEAFEYNYETYYSPFVIHPYIVDVNPDGSCGSTNKENLYDSDGNVLLYQIHDIDQSAAVLADWGASGVTQSYSATKTMSVPAGVRKNAKILLTFLDPNTLSPEGRKCLSTSSTGGNLAGIGQCGNSELQYIGGFGVDAWDRCALNNGAPCLSQNGGYSNPDDPTYNPFYDDPLGCYLCTFDIEPTCSKDNFSIRPDRMEMGMSHLDAPNLLRAGEDYNVSLTAKDAANNIPTTYTVTDHNYNNDLGIETKKYLKTGELDTTGLLNGTADLVVSSTGYMVEGLSSTSASNPGTAQEIVGVTFPDVGKVGLVIYDDEWARVDYDDTPADCNSTAHYYTCAESNVTYIPHHFVFADLNITNHGGPDNNFTYLANGVDRDLMSAKIQTRIEAHNKQDANTTNFRSGPEFYENNVTIVPHIKDNTMFDTNKDGTYGDANESTYSNVALGFTAGVRNILWDEPLPSSGGYPLNFNFKRDNDTPINPFDVNESVLSIRIDSYYTDGGNTADITGMSIGDENDTVTCTAGDLSCTEHSAENNATFFYARAKSSKFFYDDIIDSNVLTPISVVVYCDIFPTCELLTPHMKNLGQTDESYWWLSVDHNLLRTPLADGNISLDVGTTYDEGGAADVTDNVTNITNGIDNTVTVSNIGNVVPNTVEIDHDGTNGWLIYNKSSDISPPDPFYKVRFIGRSGWAGYGDTGYVVDSNSSKKKNKRLQW